ncbi:M16 family metallopeptidase [Microbulbifer taiwanensis]|uniref:M16 family metallopeptidase n=1 Tax=Microbulbifer taiwanensis TaxID=986746 RepID=UPI003609A730
MAHPDKASVFLIDKPDSEQSIIIGGLLAPSEKIPEREALHMMNDILGGTFTARINMNLREEKHWAYGAYSFMTGAKGQQPLLVYAPVQTDKTSDSLAELQRELRAYIGGEPAEAAELQKVKDKRINELPGRFETIAAVSGAVSSMVTYDRPLNYMDGYAEQIRGADLKTIHKLARQTIKPEQFIWVIVGDKKKIEKGIRGLDIGPIAELNVDGKPVGETVAAGGTSQPRVRPAAAGIACGCGRLKSAGSQHLPISGEIRAAKNQFNSTLTVAPGKNFPRTPFLHPPDFHAHQSTVTQMSQYLLHSVINERVQPPAGLGQCACNYR